MGTSTDPRGGMACGVRLFLFQLLHISKPQTVSDPRIARKVHGAHDGDAMRARLKLFAVFAFLIVIVLSTSVARVLVRGTMENVQVKQSSAATPKILLFITSHFSAEHLEFLIYCWPYAIRNSHLLQTSEKFIFSTSANESLVHSVVKNIFGNQVTIKSYKNPGYHEGAVLALDEGLKQRWFDGFDWVLRLNADVIIRNDTWILKTMSDLHVDGIFVDCMDTQCPNKRQCFSAVMHSDFFAFRPNAVSSTAVSASAHIKLAEPKVNAIFRPLVLNGRDRWLPGTNQRAICRVNGENSPVIHNHAYLAVCNASTPLSRL
ncbi:MAG: hypothetical protein J3K34DRAFT_446887 [Monoraphidium minutum]|nr:MAG: hypothetical protein J3K34DRAFT_446887 [Monoraphidium minutum]